MADEKKVEIHLDFANQDPEIPEMGLDQCPDCKVPYEVGFGLAGGGYGTYTFCPECGKLLSKQQESE